MKKVHIGAVFLAAALMIFPLGAYENVHAAEDDASPVPKKIFLPIKAGMKIFSEPSQKQNSQKVQESPVVTESLPDAEGPETPWNMILVNEWSPLPEDFTVALIPLAGGGQVDYRIQEPLERMIQDAAARGVNLLVSSSYRSVAYQETLYQRKVQDYQNYGLALEDAQEQARQWVARPGRSEHHTGLAVDITTLSYQVLDSGFAGTAAAGWLLEHSAEYGFILRYPEGKTEITGVCWEPWHFRYVGEEAAKKIMQDGICLEEYLEAGSK